MRELMRRIAELKAIRWNMVNGKADPEVFPAAIDWLDNTIAEHEADLDELCKGAA